MILSSLLYLDLFGAVPSFAHRLVSTTTTIPTVSNSLRLAPPRLYLPSSDALYLTPL